MKLSHATIRDLLNAIDGQLYDEGTTIADVAAHRDETGDAFNSCDPVFDAYHETRMAVCAAVAALDALDEVLKEASDPGKNPTLIEHVYFYALANNVDSDFSPETPA